MLPENIDQQVATLEKQELEAPNGVASLQLYTELFAAYLYKNELSQARFLWKRIPQNIKGGNAELERLFTVLQCLWSNKNVEFYKAITYDWSKAIAKLMAELKEKVQMETINLIGRAYSSIFENVFADMTNHSPEVVTETCKSLNWEIIEGPFPRLIIPKKPPVEKLVFTSCEDQLQKLTDFVSFLEN
ncbi:COP9 signalosome complex subunit 8 [Phlebotomus argentipes]|uniref:COP9 signalosome complex subunit 8 n=1 Tax=Phlebotomus argentipes TaxID=94469 RepID=UPI002892B08C|nr:COP9 signalosome complex subunit 8 [Phlebotomus argentipes]